MKKTQTKTVSRKSKEKVDVEHNIIKWAGIILTFIVVFQIIAMKSLSVYEELQANLFKISQHSVEQTESH